MATTTPTRDLATRPDAHAEHDKLGPLGRRRSVIEDEGALRHALVSEFAAAASAARDAAASVQHDAAAAVHAYRKALRRARGVLALVSGALPRSERRAVRRALRDARRALGAARDHAAAPEVAATLELDEVQRATLAAILTAASEASPPVSEVAQLLAEGAARAAAQVEALEAALPPTLPWSTVLQGVRRAYATARRARKAARRSRRSFHAWRRRSKELSYQLDLLASYTGEQVAELHHEIEAASETQRPAVDLLMLREFVRTHGAGTAPEALGSVVDAIERQLDDRIADSRDAGRDAFARRPRRLARKLAKAARADAAPAPSADELD